MEVRAGYKQTEVGVIPEDWEVTTIGDTCDYQNGTALEKYFNRYAGYKVISIGNYSETGSFVETGTFIDQSYNKEVGKFIVNKNDLTMILNDKTAIGTIIGRVLLIKSDESYVFNQRTMRLKSKDNISSKFLFFLINSNHVHSRIVGMAKPGTQIYVNTDDITNFKIILPPTKAEQEAIAGALSDADGLIESLEQLIAKKRAIKQGTMQELLTGKKRLPGFTGEWEVKRFGDVIDTDPENLGGNTSRDYQFNYISLENVDCGILRGFSEQKFETAPSRARRILRPNDVLVSTVRPNLMSHLLFCLTEKNWVCSTGFCVVRCRKGITNPYFIFSHMFSSMINRQIDALLTGSNYPAINSREISDLEILLPGYEEQAAIATILSDMETEIIALKAKLAKARQIKQGMMQELLTGKIRLI